ncbi:glycosyltransferase family 2 protein [archaeon]|nr:glycosyltransferase family 2 protein [archaeon]MBL7051357.1 glycosyltransferase family 2 protein [Candidatus Woesearchaeota archaeon]
MKKIRLYLGKIKWLKITYDRTVLFFQKTKKKIRDSETVTFLSTHISGLRIHKLDSKRILLNAHEIRLFMVVRNESLRLPYFFKYYSKLGVDRFFIVDNSSTDDTLDFLLKQKNTHVFETKEHFDRQAYRINYMLRKYGIGHWCVIVDADEIFKYPHSENINLKQISKFLDTEGYSALHCLLLDMYSKTPFSSVVYKKGENPLTKYSYFDSDGYSQEEHPFRLRKKSIKTGGVRLRVLNVKPWLSKYPLVKFHKGIFLEWGTHVVHGANIANIQGVSLHFKFMNDIHQKITERSEWVDEWNKDKPLNGYSEECKIYAEKMQNKNLTFYYSKSKKFKYEDQLMKYKLMKSTKKFDEYVKNEK